MGTGSHRPQWEAAKGRPDELGGIKHARALRSHTRLKYRPKRDLAVRKEIDSQQNQLSEFNLDRVISRASNVSDLNKKITGETSSNEKPSDEKPSSKRITSEEKISSDLSSSPITRADSEQDSSKSDSESDSESMAEELSRLKKNQQQKQKRVPSWRSESAFSRTATRPDNEDPFLSRYIR